MVLHFFLVSLKVSLKAIYSILMICPLTFLVSYRLFDSAKALAFENVPTRDEVSLRCIQFI